MRIDEKLTSLEYLNLYKVTDDESSPAIKGYFYAERVGKDSVAFVCVNKEDHSEILLNKEYKPPIGSFMLGAFGGSNDKDKSFDQIVIEEVKEEAGYVVSEEDVIKIGEIFVSNMMNQYCHLYVVFIDADQEPERNPQNEVEAAATTEWHSIRKIHELEDWKPLAILTKAHEMKKIDVPSLQS